MLSPTESGALYEAKQRQLESQKNAELAQALDELRWAIGAAHSVNKLAQDLRELLPHWEVEFQPLNSDAKFDFPMLLNATPPDPSPEQVQEAFNAHQWHHDFVEAGIFIEESSVTLACGDFGAEAHFRKPSTYHFRTKELEWKRYVHCELFDDAAIEIDNFDPPSFDQFAANSDAADLYSDRLKLLHAWILERFAEFCAVRGVSPEQYELEWAAKRKHSAPAPAESPRPPQASRTAVGGILNYLKETLLALLLVFAFVMAFGLVVQWIETVTE